MPPVAELQMRPWGTSILGNQAPQALSLQESWGPASLSHSLLTGGSPGRSLKRKHCPGHDEWTYWGLYIMSSDFRQRTRGGGRLSRLSVPCLTDSHCKEKGNDRPKGQTLGGIKVRRCMLHCGLVFSPLQPEGPHTAPPPLCYSWQFPAESICSR